MLIILALCFAFSEVKSQVYTATAKLDTAKILVGEHAILTLNIRIPSENLNNSKQFLNWHSLKDTISDKIEIVEFLPIDTSLSSDKKTYLLSQKIVVTGYDSGFAVIPPIRFIKNNDSLKFIETQALLLEVGTVPVDTTAEIKDIKKPLEKPFSIMEMLPYIAGGVALIGIIGLIALYLSMKESKKKAFFKPEIKLQAHETAFLKLKLLKDKNLWQEGKFKEYHTELTDIIRIYIEDRYKVPAMEQTSDEIILTFRSVSIPNEAQIKLTQALKLSDLVKFAKINPIPSENETSFANAEDFIKLTALKTELTKSAEQGGES